LSVVVASFRDSQLLTSCLDSLLRQCRQHGAELIVCRDQACGDLDDFARRYPDARFIAAPRGSNVPVLRGLGMAKARGAWVALLEDHCIAAEDWLDKLSASFDGSAVVVGGGMGNAQTGRLIDWGAYFSEYGFFDANRAPGGQGAPLLTGANVAYARAVVPEVARFMQSGDWENTVHQRLASAGQSLRFVAEARVYQNLHYRFGAFCVDRFVHGRDFARTRLRMSRSGRLQRYAFAGLSPMLPPLLLGRLWRSATGDDAAQRAAFLRAGPFTWAFLASWSIGESVGYWLGPDHDERAE
jgi:GT2 family glycosyltransferase